MTSATKTRKSRKTTEQTRHVAIGKPTKGGVFAICMTVGQGEKAKHFGYYVHPLAADFGLAFRVEKFAAECEEGEPCEYAVNVDAASGRHSCECKGFLRHRHCKHVEALSALVNAGKL